MGGTPDAEEAKSRRRTLYLLQKRQKPPAVQAIIDGPTAATESCAKRPVSTVPLQALYLLNNEFGMGRARAFAERVELLAGDDCVKHVETAFQLALGRAPDDAERSAALRFLADGASRESKTDARPLVLLCQAMQNLNEFVSLE